MNGHIHHPIAAQPPHHHHPAEPARADGLRPPATGTPAAPGIGEVIGWVDDRPIPRAHLDRRIADLRNGPLRAALPVPGSSEDRQLARWLTQVILTEALCETTARALGLTPLEGPPLDRLAAVELGSINTAAYNGNPWVRAMFEHVTAGTEIPPEWRPRISPERSPRHYVHHRLFADRRSAEQATLDGLESLGYVELDSLPAAVAEAIQDQPFGTLVGPVRDALGWHVATATPTRTPSPMPVPSDDRASFAASTPLAGSAPSVGPAPSTSPPPPAVPAEPQSSGPAAHHSTISPERETAPSPEHWPPEQGPAEPELAEPRPAEPRPAGEDPDPIFATAISSHHHTAFTLPDHDKAPLLKAARRRTFARWLDELRAEKVKLVPGLEHPGDPRQPDNHHKH